jgi:hypothetical protein
MVWRMISVNWKMVWIESIVTYTLEAWIHKQEFYLFRSAYCILRHDAQSPYFFPQMVCIS